MPQQIKTGVSMAGFVATVPSLTRTDNGARAYFRAGQEHYTRNPDGSFTQEETTFHDVVLFRKPAERAVEMFKKGDRFIAEGTIHAYQATSPSGVTEEREEFVARKIGHDMAYTTYQIDRTPRIQQGPTNTVETGPRPADPAQPATMGA